MIKTHKSILKKFEEEIISTEQFLSKISRYKHIPCICSLIDQHKIKLNNQCGKLLYLLDSYPLINEYNFLLKQPVSRNDDNCDIKKRKINVEKLYDHIVVKILREKSWNDVYQEKQYNKKNTCANCGASELETDDSGKRTCVSCFYEIQTLESGNTHLDYNRATIIGKPTYIRLLHFEDCIRQFQGKQKCKIPQFVFDDLDKKFKEYKLLLDSPNHVIKYSRITKQHIQSFLKELKYVKQYKNINVIFTALTSNKTDLNIKEQQLIEDFKEFVTLYDSLHGKDKSEELDRKNFLNAQYLLFQLLRRHGYKCTLEDFSVLKTTERKLYHDKICSNLFQILGWNFTPTF
jgi:hypothetical protein